MSFNKKKKFQRRNNEVERMKDFGREGFLVFNLCMIQILCHLEELKIVLDENFEGFFGVFKYIFNILSMLL
jgi:hypothetical protein